MFTIIEASANLNSNLLYIFPRLTFNDFAKYYTNCSDFLSLTFSI